MLRPEPVEDRKSEPKQRYGEPLGRSGPMAGGHEQLCAGVAGLLAAVFAGTNDDFGPGQASEWGGGRGVAAALGSVLIVGGKVAIRLGHRGNGAGLG